MVLRGPWLRGGILADAAGYSLERAVRLGLTAVVGIFVARHLGPDGFGLLSYGYSVFAILAPLSLLGMRMVLVREFSISDDWQVVLASALGRQLPVALLASVGGFFIIAGTRSFDTDATLIALALVPLPILATGDNLRALFEATGRVRSIVMAGVVAISVTSLFRVVAVVLDAPIWVFAVTATVDSLLVLVGLLMGFRGRKTPGAAIRMYRREVASDLLRESWPLLIAGFAVLLYLRADIVMLGLLADDKATGIYVAAARFSEMWYFLPMAAMAAVRPRLARLHAASETAEYRNVTQRFMSAAFATSLVAIVFTLILGRPLIEAAYGPGFVAATDVLRIHILAAPFIFLAVAAGQWFIDRGMTKAVMVRSSLGAGINLTLNLALIPAHGATGAAVATLVSYALAGVIINAVFPTTREVFWMQARALAFAWR